MQKSNDENLDNQIVRLIGRSHDTKGTYINLNKGYWYRYSDKKWLKKETPCLIGFEYVCRYDNDRIFIISINVQLKKIEDKESRLSYAIVHFKYIDGEKQGKSCQTFIEKFWIGDFLLKTNNTN